MATDLAYNVDVPGLRRSDVVSYFAARAALARPPSQSTLMDEGHSDNDDSSYLEDSPFTSVVSLDSDSISSASTSNEATTPESTGLTAFDFHIDEKNIKGPNGPHLFRTYSEASEYSSIVGTDLSWEDQPPSAMAPFYQSASKLDPIRKDTPVPNRVSSTPQPQPTSQLQQRPRPQLQLQPQPQPQLQPNLQTQPLPHPQHPQQRVFGQPQVPVLDEAGIRQWRPEEVVQWLHAHGFDSGITETFYVNDISGPILLELQTEDLKELGIQSFGKRHMLMGAIKKLRERPTIITAPVPTSTETDAVPATPHTLVIPATPRTGVTHASSECPPGSASDEYSCESFSEGRRHRLRESDNHSRRPRDLQPGDSVSIVAIEQILPKLHSCSKGENCRKWQKQQSKLAHLAKDLPTGNMNGRIILTGDPGNPKTAPNLVKTPKSDITPSLIASSDVMGPLQTPGLGLSKEKLNEVQPRDPQENVRNFLSFQHLSNIQPASNPPTPPTESPQSHETSVSPKANPTLSENLRHLPKLMIPGTVDLERDSLYTANLSSQRTVTQEYPTAIPRGQQRYAYGTTESPGDFYRTDPHYGQDTPLSEVDVPMTAFPVGLVPREESQSVPPNMRFGSDRIVMLDPVPRPASTKVEHHRRNISHQQAPPMRSLDEHRVLEPIDTPEDMARIARKGYSSPTRRSPDDVTHSGWMRKRKTTRLLRHEWEEGHYTLKGTQLARHADRESAQRNSKALEYIDVDDYAVACSSLASSSKLTAAFKKTMLKRKEIGPSESAFSFSLVPATGTGNTVVDKKALFLNSGKSHHFAVKTRDERIDWMRELMLAKALKRGRENGFDMANNFI
ncbi:SAM and PH domain protein [Aspergillus japonicus CBS 114.51]|uniref:SAM and PH domain protein n=2 Tax=Aspergillus TaxID=5052 RepID=A0A2V5H6J6_ASPV1|nr:SAM and PH domain protein [Aspergillus japonicus CBS 114.51]PYI19855.1 SAM and PH domain protein [Aspergillus violaceofuscus CBS 115571]RAH78497.1 SAM and PH domain protein [Aspergillus japonicus CBS 114.51]